MDNCRFRVARCAIGRTACSARPFVAFRPDSSSRWKEGRVPAEDDWPSVDSARSGNDVCKLRSGQASVRPRAHGYAVVAVQQPRRFLGNLRGLRICGLRNHPRLWAVQPPSLQRLTSRVETIEIRADRQFWSPRIALCCPRHPLVSLVGIWVNIARCRIVVGPPWAVPVGWPIPKRTPAESPT